MSMSQSHFHSNLLKCMVEQHNMLYPVNVFFSNHVLSMKKSSHELKTWCLKSLHWKIVSVMWRSLISFKRARY